MHGTARCAISITAFRSPSSIDTIPVRTERIYTALNVTLPLAVRIAEFRGLHCHRDMYGAVPVWAAAFAYLWTNSEINPGLPAFQWKFAL